MKNDKVKQALSALNNWFGKSDELKVVINLLEEALTPEPRFYKNQPVLVRCNEGNDWVQAILRRIDHDGYLTHAGIGYQQCKPDPDAESIINWVEYTDEQPGIILCPENCQIISMAKTGRTTLFASGVDFRARLSANVARYTIIPLPEFLS